MKISFLKVFEKEKNNFSNKYRGICEWDSRINDFSLPLVKNGEVVRGN
jgi:hypothetical protein